MVLIFALLSSFAHAIATASSTLKNEDGTHRASNTVDGLLSTGWSEGIYGNGEGEWLELKLNKTTEIKTLSLWPGNFKKGKRSFSMEVPKSVATPCKRYGRTFNEHDKK